MSQPPSNTQFLKVSSTLMHLCPEPWREQMEPLVMMGLANLTEEQLCELSAQLDSAIGEDGAVNVDALRAMAARYGISDQQISAAAASLTAT